MSSEEKRGKGKGNKTKQMTGNNIKQTKTRGRGEKWMGQYCIEKVQKGTDIKTQKRDRKASRGRKTKTKTPKPKPYKSKKH